jgi:hypothetical protein
MASGSKRDSSQRLDIGSDLASGDPASQSNALLAVIALQSAGRDITAYVTHICQHIVGNVNVPFDIRLKAYDVIQASILSDTDTQWILQGILSDLQMDPGPATEHIHVSAFVAMRRLSSHRLVSFMSDPKVIPIVRGHLEQSSPPVRAAGVQSIAMVMSFDTMMKLLGENKNLGALFNNFIKNVSSMLVDSDPELTLGGAHALQLLLQTMTEKVRAGCVTFGKAVVTSAESQYSQATLLALSVCEEAVVTIDGMFAEVIPKFRTLSLDYKRQVLRFLVSYLDAKVLVYSMNTFDYRPGEILRHQMDEVVNFLAECAANFDPPLVIESTKALLSLVKIDKSSASLYSQVTISIQSCIDSINSLEGRYQHVAQRGLLDAFLSHMDALPPAQQVTLFGTLPKMIATIPSARQRVKSFVRLWYSVAAYDWKMNSCINSIIEEADEGSVIPISEVQHILLEKNMKDCIAGTRSNDGNVSHIRYHDPVYREEVVGSLLYVLLTHPAPVTGLANSASLGKTSANSALIAATGIQAAGSALDWLFTAKASLQNTKPCLGWDRVSGVETTGTTLCVDLWLQLLLRCISISSQLKTRINNLPDNHLGGEPELDKEASDDEVEAGVSNLIPALKHRAALMEVEFQGLLQQIATNWRALHPIVRPRAIWICANNLKFKSIVDVSWNSLADALKSLLVEAEHVGSSNPSRYFPSVAEGSIRTYPLTDSKRRSAHDPFVAAASGETEEMCVLVLERLANLLSHSHHGELRGKLSDIAGMLESLTKICASKNHLSPSSLQRLESVQKLLAPISSSHREGSKSGGNSAATTISVRHSITQKVENSEDARSPQQNTVVDLKDDLGISLSYPSTVPSSPSLVNSDVVRRYQQVWGDLQGAIISSDDTTKQSPSIGLGDASVGLPTLSTTLEVLHLTEGEDSLNRQHAWTELTGLFSPVTLAFSHSLEPSSSTIRLKCRIENKTSDKISGMEVQLIMGGPIAMHRRPISYKIRPLSSLDVFEWEIPCRCLSFGWPVVQPFLILPVECPSGFGQTFNAGSIRCKPYAVSPLELILKSNRAIFPAEFFQLWQTFPHRANAYAVPVDRGMIGVVKVLSSIESAGLVCCSKVLVSGSGGMYAAYSGISWSGHTIALIVTSVTLPSRKGGNKAGSSKDIILNFHFGSDVSEVIVPMRGHEHELVSQLTRRRAIPVSSPHAIALNSMDPVTKDQKKEVEEPRVQSTFSFFKSMIHNAESEEEEEGEYEKKRVAARERKQNMQETCALTSAAVDMWKSLQQAS